MNLKEFEYSLKKLYRKVFFIYIKKNKQLSLTNKRKYKFQVQK